MRAQKPFYDFIYSSCWISLAFMHTHSITCVYAAENVLHGRWLYMEDLLVLKSATPFTMSLSEDCSVKSSPLKADVWERLPSAHPERRYTMFSSKQRRSSFLSKQAGSIQQRCCGKKVSKRRIGVWLSCTSAAVVLSDVHISNKLSCVWSQRYVSKL